MCRDRCSQSILPNFRKVIQVEYSYSKMPEVMYCILLYIFCVPLAIISTLMYLYRTRRFSRLLQMILFFQI